MAAPATRRNLTAVGLITAALGIILLTWLVRTLGPGEIWAGFRRIGWGLAAIIALGGLRFGARATAWAFSVEPPARLRVTDAFAAVVSGDALGNVLPLGPIVSEPAKAAFVKGRVPMAPAVTALVIENVFYTLSVAAMIAAATLALLFRFELPGPLRDTSETAVAAIAILFVAAMWVLWRRPALISRSLSALARPGASHALQARLSRLRALEEEIYSFATRRREAVAPIVAAELAFHALGVVEVYLTLRLMEAQPSLLTAFIFEGANRLVMVLFKIVPLRLGVDEATSASIAPILGFTPAAGATLAIVRRARVVFWMFAGIVLLVRHRLSVRRLLEEAQLTAASKHS